VTSGGLQSDCENIVTTAVRATCDKTDRCDARMLLDREKSRGGGAGHRAIICTKCVCVSSVLLVRPVTPRYGRILPNVGGVGTKKATAAAIEIPPPRCGGGGGGGYRAYIPT